MVAELSLLARIGRRLTGKAPLDPGDADAWRSELHQLADAITLSCWGVSAGRATKKASADDSMDRLKAQAARYLQRTEYLAPLVNHDRQTAVLLAESRARAQRLKDGADFWAGSVFQNSGADQVMWLEHRLIDAAFLELSGVCYVDDFLLPPIRRAFTWAGVRKTLRHGRYVSSKVFGLAVRSVHTSLTPATVQIRLELPGSTDHYEVELEPADVARVAEWEKLKGHELSHEVLELVRKEPPQALPWS